MKKILIFGILLCLLLNLVSAQSLTVVDGKIIGENVYKPSFWDTLFSSQGFYFVGNPTEVRLANSNLCTVGQASGVLSHMSGTAKTSGDNCNVGQFITFIASSDSTDGTIKKGQYLFDKLFYKSSSSDLLDWSKFYLNQKTFTYNYVCLDCKEIDTTNTEEGCLSKDKSKCVTASNSNCGMNYNYQSVCLTHISSTTGSSIGVPSTDTTTISPKMTFGDIKVTNSGTIELGQIFEISGSVYIEGTVNGGVVETGYTSEYFTPLTISASGQLNKGVCGDDLTTGVKFSTSNNWVVFKLPMTAEKLGKQRLKIIASPGCGSGIISDTKYIELNVIESNLPPQPEITTPSCPNTLNSVACKPITCEQQGLITSKIGETSVCIKEGAKPTWFSTQNMIIATVGMAILIVLSLSLNKRKRK